jgi:hypothetical protein
MEFDPLSASLRSAPLPRSTGERMGARSEAERGHSIKNRAMAGFHP